MVTLKIDTDDWPDWMEEAISIRAKRYGISPGAFIAEVLTAFVEKREPEFKREETES